MHRSNPIYRRLWLLAFALVVIAFSWLRPIDGAARVQVRGDLVRAAKVFAIARAIGATLSVAQSANVDVKLFGTGVGVAPGQVQDGLDAGRLVPLLEAWWPSFGGFCLYHPSRAHIPGKLGAFIDFMRRPSKA